MTVGHVFSSRFNEICHEILIGVTKIKMGWRRLLTFHLFMLWQLLNYQWLLLLSLITEFDSFSSNLLNTLKNSFYLFLLIHSFIRLPYVLNLISRISIFSMSLNRSLLFFTVEILPPRFFINLVNLSFLLKLPCRPESQVLRMISLFIYFQLLRFFNLPIIPLYYQFPFL